MCGRSRSWHRYWPPTPSAEKTGVWKAEPVARISEAQSGKDRRAGPGFRGVYHRARIRATRWLIRATGERLRRWLTRSYDFTPRIAALSSRTSRLLRWTTE